MDPRGCGLYHPIARVAQAAPRAYFDHGSNVFDHCFGIESREG
jgi:hypothetical protein